MAIPSIALIPSGYKANKLYSVLPTSGAGDLDFSRATGGAGTTGNATRVNQNGLLETVLPNVPRLDYSESGCPSLLLEPQSTNLIPYSEDFSQSVWETWQVTKTQSNGINPKGTNGYYEILHTGSSTNNPNTRLLNVSLNGLHTLSFFVKTNQSRYISLSVEDYDGDRARLYFDTINKTFTTIINTGSPITNTSYSEFSNDWVRISLSVNLLNAVYNEVGIGIYNPSGTFQSASGDVISVFGAMLEQGGNPTSYIKTEGSTVTRIQDTASKSGLSSLINSAEGVLYVEMAAIDNSLTYKEISISDGIPSNRIEIRYLGNKIEFTSRISGVAEVYGFFTPISVFNFNKIALKYSGNEFKLYVNGSLVATDTSTNTFVFNAFSSVRFDSGAGASIFYGKVKNLQVYNTALTDLELEKLTSYTSFSQMATALNYEII